MFYTIRLDRDIIKWKMMRINLILYNEKKDLLPIREKNKQWIQLKVNFFLKIITFLVFFRGFGKKSEAFE